MSNIKKYLEAKALTLYLSLNQHFEIWDELTLNFLPLKLKPIFYV